MKEDIIEEFTSLKSVGESKAKALYEAGYESIEELADATVKELSEVKGITSALAKDIKDQVSEAVKDKSETVEEDKADEEIIEVPPAELKMDPESLRLMKVRKKQKLKKPHFVQTDQHKKKRLKDTWRKPKGLHNKKRQYILGKGEMARPGYGSPTAVKGLHPSGFIEVLLDRIQDVDNIDPNTQAIRISRTVGQRKRLEILKKAKSMGLKILNPPLTRRYE